jgi:hypothetical protein
MTTRTRITEGDGDPRHGTVNGYNNLRCRCPHCTKAVTRSIAERRARIAGTLTPDDPRHGTHNAYDNYSCRCPPCTLTHLNRLHGT